MGYEYQKSHLIALFVVAYAAFYYAYPHKRPYLLGKAGFNPDPPKVRRRLMISAGVWFLSYYIMAVFGGAVAYSRIPKVQSDMPQALPDLGLELIGSFCPLESPNNIQSLVLLIMYLYLGYIALYKQNGRLILQRYLHISALIFLTRTTTVGLTSLPNPNPAGGCIRAQQWDDITYWDAFAKVVLGSFPPHACGDLIYSGHAACTISAMVIFSYHDCYPNRFVEGFFWLMTAICGYSLVGCRSHYTVDIVLGAYFAFAICQWYLLRADDPRGGTSRNRWIAWLECQDLEKDNRATRWDPASPLLKPRAPLFSRSQTERRLPRIDELVETAAPITEGGPVEAVPLLCRQRPHVI
jgi:hypothetical protein